MIPLVTPLRTVYNIEEVISIARRTSAVHGFYRYAARHAAVVGSPFTGIARPAVDDESMSTGLGRDEVHALFAAARAHSPRSEALGTAPTSVDSSGGVIRPR